MCSLYPIARHSHGRQPYGARSYGFTLIELSIALVVIALLISAILVGEDLIRAAAMRKAATDISSFKNATNTFYNKYRAFPGDMRNATRFWGAADSNPTTCASIASTTGDSATCNGNGNRRIDTPSERFRFWQHLANEGIVPGDYTGVQGPLLMGHEVPGSNVPITSWKSGGVAMFYGPPINSWGWDHYFRYGAEKTSGAPLGLTNILTVPEAREFDNKVDDGLPGRGDIKASQDSAFCITNFVSEQTAIYRTDRTDTVDCVLYLDAGF